MHRMFWPALALAVLLAGAAQGDGNVRYYDSRGSSLDTSTTIGNTTLRARAFGPLPFESAVVQGVG